MHRLLGSTLNASALRTFIRAGIAMAVAFGLSWSGEQVAAAVLFLETGLQLGQTYYTKGG